MSFTLCQIQYYIFKMILLVFIVALFLGYLIYYNNKLSMPFGDV